jgi:hypothetical protein
MTAERLWATKTNGTVRRVTTAAEHQASRTKLAQTLHYYAHTEVHLIHAAATMSNSASN